jgi:choice-of-anchor A domain-containing protein
MQTLHFASTVLFALFTPLAHAQTASLPNEFNVYTFKDFKAYGCDVEGAVGVGANVELRKYSIGQRSELREFVLSAQGSVDLYSAHIQNGGVQAGKDALIGVSRIEGAFHSGGNIVAHRSDIQGNAMAAGSVDLLFSTARRALGQQAYGSTVDHDKIQKQIADASATYAACPATGKVAVVGNDRVALVFLGKAGVNVYDLSTELVSKAWGFTFDGPADSTFILNIKGENVAISDGVSRLTGGVTSSNVLFNLVDAKSLLISKITLLGTVLAPLADTTHEQSLLEGSLYVGSLRGGKAATQTTPEIAGGQVNVTSFFAPSSPCGK